VHLCALDADSAHRDDRRLNLCINGHGDTDCELRGTIGFCGALACRPRPSWAARPSCLRSAGRDDARSLALSRSHRPRSPPGLSLAGHARHRMAEGTRGLCVPRTPFVLIT
jgi:hypothetical protein